MIPYANKMSESERKGMTKVQITQWFRAKTYKIERIDKEGIYFIAPELAWENGYGHKGYNVNFDYLYLGKTPRFRVYDASKEPRCTAARFFTMENCSYRCLTIKGIEFRSTAESNSLLCMINVNAKQITVGNCIFDYVRGNDVGYFSGTGNVVFDDNTVSKIAPYPFAVYLIHANGFWKGRIWEAVIPDSFHLPIIVYCLASCLFIFIACVVIDIIRSYIFKKAKIDYLVDRLASKLPQL